jgi:REP element-mobilizing transposase RayT
MPARPHSWRLRLGRYSQTDQVYLITAVTHQRQPFFADWRAGRLLVHQLRKAQDAGWADSLAWVVMPDHVHWLMQLKGRDLSSVVHRVKCQGAGQVNGYLGRSGQFWQRGFHDRALRNDEDLRPVARYIIANPIRAGLVKRVHDYPLWDAHWLDGCEY